MYTLTAVFRAPEDKEAFNAHYNTVHQPLVKKMEGVRKIEVTRVDRMLTPPNNTFSQAPHLICTMYFDSKEDLKSMTKAPGGIAATKDLMGFAGELVSMVAGETTEVPV